MLLLEHVKALIKKYVAPEEKVVVAVSGGIDSMCLLYCCEQTLDKKQLIVAHMDHGLRKKSKEDRLFIEQYCKERGIAFEYREISVEKIAQEKKESIEECARNERYSFLRNVKDAHLARFILTAHHQDDNVETILFHWIRGAGLHGLIGMRQITDEVLRPFLRSVSKANILEFAEQHKIPFVHDESNDIPAVSRNIIRLEILPLIRKINPNFSKTILKNTVQFFDIERGLEQQARETISIGNDLYIEQEEFQKKTKAEQRAILKILYLQRYGSTENLSFDLLEDVRQFVLESSTGKKKPFGLSLQLENQYGKIIALSDHGKNLSLVEKQILSIGSMIEFNNYKITTSFSLAKTDEKDTISIDIDNIDQEMLFVRTWKTGDIFIPFGMKGRKKLQDFFTDQKIPLRLRHFCPVVVDKHDNIISVGAFRIDDRYKLKETTKKVLHITFSPIC